MNDQIFQLRRDTGTLAHITAANAANAIRVAAKYHGGTESEWRVVSTMRLSAGQSPFATVLNNALKKATP